MTLREHYKYHSRKSLKPYKSLIPLIVLFIVILHTFSRYNNLATANAIMQTAKFSVVINGQTITSDTSTLTQTINLTNSSDNTTQIGSDDECYFDITIDPSTTQVSISYTITADLTSGNNTLPTGTVIDRYAIYTGSSETLASTVNVNATSVSIGDTISLSNMQTALDNSSIRKFRIYCLVPSGANITNGQSFTISPTIAVQQVIGAST